MDGWMKGWMDGLKVVLVLVFNSFHNARKE
jgi:hypothetical protein